LFDKDGTLFAFTESWGPITARFLLEIAGGDTARADRYGRHIGFEWKSVRFAAESPVIAGTEQDVAVLLEKAGAGEAAALARLMQIRAAEAEPVPAVPLAPLMAALRAQGLKLGVMTNDAESAARAHLDQQGVGAAFDFVAGYDSGFGAKPDPAPLLAFAAHVGLPPAQVAMIGDSLHDLTAARAAGMIGVGVLSGPATAETLAPHAHAVLPDIGHLPDWLAALAARG
jgi:phosphoglycolate phosphatase